MKIKEFIKNTFQKLKSVLSLVKAFITKKRFSILSFLLALFLIGSIGSCRIREPTTANADDTVVSDSPFYLLNIPSFGVNGQYYASNYILSMHKNLDGNLSLRFLWGEQRYTGSTESVLYRRNIPDLGFEYLMQSEYASLYYYDLNGVIYDVSVIFKVYAVANSLTSDIFEYLPYVEEVRYFGYSGSLFYHFYAPSLGGHIFTMSIAPKFVGTSLSAAAEYTMPVFTSYVTNSEGSYSQGYRDGYSEGLNTRFEDISPFSIIVSGVNSFLDIELFGGVSVSILLSLGFGIILLGFAIKIFLGG